MICHIRWGEGLKQLGCCEVGLVSRGERGIAECYSNATLWSGEMESFQHTWGPVAQETEKILLAPKQKCECAYSMYKCVCG